MSQFSAAEATDRFRLAFFQNVIVEEQKRLRETQQRQRSCYHRYKFLSVLPNQQTEWICPKCDHVIQRRLPVSSLSLLPSNPLNPSDPSDPSQ